MIHRLFGEEFTYFCKNPSTNESQNDKNKLAVIDDHCYRADLKE